MKMSAEGRKRLMQREGVKLHAYKDSVGVWTIGIGHTSMAGPPQVTPGLTITQAECEAIFARDLVQYENAVNRAVTLEVSQNEFDAMVSLCYNIGTGGFTKSSVVRNLNAGNREAAAASFMAWSKPKEIIGRRRTEQQQFKTPYPRGVGVAPAPVPLPTPTTVPAGPKDVKDLSVMGGLVATLTAGWQAFWGSGAIRFAVVALIGAALYWFIARPILRRMSALEGFYAHADDIELGLVGKVRLALKGVKTFLWGRFLAIAGTAAGILQFADVIDFTTILPPIKGIPATAYVPLVLGPLLAIVNNQLRKATTTPAGQTDLALAPVTEAPPLVPEAEPEPLKRVWPRVKAKRKARKAKAR